MRFSLGDKFWMGVMLAVVILATLSLVVDGLDRFNRALNAPLVTADGRPTR